MSLTPKPPWETDDGGRSGSSSGRGWVPQEDVMVAADRDKG